MSAIHTTPNEVRRFIIENQPVRGYWVDLQGAWRDLRAHQEYPAAVRDLLGEAVSASVLLAATLKFQGTLTLQLESQGQVRLLVAQCTHDFRVRAVARLNDGEAEEASDTDSTSSDTGASVDDRGVVVDVGVGEEVNDPFAAIARVARTVSAQTFRRLVGEDGRVLVTIEAAERDMRYQGIVPLSGDSLSACLEEYFASSEQLPTRVRLAANDQRTVGLLVQKLPERNGEEVERDSAASAAWRAAERGIESVQPAELVGGSLQNVLGGRFGQQDVRVFKGAPVQFACRCSEARVAGVLRTLGAEEVREVLREQGSVEVTCEFCQRPYRFDAFAVEQLFAPDSVPPAGESLH
ncbi:MAG TPA: Hsp33 family molecular chaperone HslO [Steroidobacteraceae bacterium]|jgi:molecular chaperone Hsp33|nr:Hsp33 family molecular chaperone HslO [Steroidobacteraceae bacterium]